MTLVKMAYDFNFNGLAGQHHYFNITQRLVGILVQSVVFSNLYCVIYFCPKFACL